MKSLQPPTAGSATACQMTHTLRWGERDIVSTLYRLRSLKDRKSNGKSILVCGCSANSWIWDRSKEGIRYPLLLLIQQAEKHIHNNYMLAATIGNIYVYTYKKLAMTFVLSSIIDDRMRRRRSDGFFFCIRLMDEFGNCPTTGRSPDDLFFCWFSAETSSGSSGVGAWFFSNLTAETIDLPLFFFLFPRPQCHRDSVSSPLMLTTPSSNQEAACRLNTYVCFSQPLNWQTCKVTNTLLPLFFSVGKRSLQVWPERQQGCGQPALWTSLQAAAG